MGTSGTVSLSVRYDNPGQLISTGSLRFGDGNYTVAYGTVTVTCRQHHTYRDIILKSKRGLTSISTPWELDFSNM